MMRHITQLLLIGILAFFQTMYSSAGSGLQEAKVFDPADLDRKDQAITSLREKNYRLQSERDDALRERDRTIANDVHWENLRQEAYADLRCKNWTLAAMTVALIASFVVKLDAGMSYKQCIDDKRNLAEDFGTTQLEWKEFKNGFNKGFAPCKKEDFNSAMPQNYFAMGQTIGFQTCKAKRKAITQRNLEEKQKKEFSKMKMRTSRRNSINSRPMNGKLPKKR